MDRWGYVNVKVLTDCDPGDTGDNSTDEAGAGPGGRLAIQRGTPAWLRRQQKLVLFLDATAAAGATLLASLWAFGPGLATVHVRSFEIPYSAAVFIAVPVWLAVLAASRCYDFGPFGFASRESRRIVRAGAHFLAATAIIYYLMNVERVAREFLVAIIPLAMTLTLLGRWIARRHLRLKRHYGHAERHAMFIGPARATQTLLDHLARHPHCGLGQAAITGDGRPATTAGGTNGDDPVLRATDADEAMRLLPSTDADLVVVTGALGAGELRELTWKLEGTGVDVLVAPAAGQLAGPQFDVRPVAGLPLLHVDR